jgi:hypothetical protein
MYTAEQAQNPSTGSALAVTAQATGNYGPGIQSWYNNWVQPDPGPQQGGVPTRVLFGLEEVWMNDNTSTPQSGPSSFHVIGRYFGGSTCLFLTPQGLSPVAGVPYVCPTNRGDTFTITNTTHPDQHAALFIPHADGSETLVVGNDGGVYTQTVKPGADYDNDHWGVGANVGLHDLFPYDAVIDGDGTAWMGLQDNGTAKIQDTVVGGKVQRQRQIETQGGDGFFVGSDPRNSKLAYEEYVYGSMSGTNDGGKTWNGMAPPNSGSGSTAQFSTQFAVDPKDPLHVMIPTSTVDETGSGPGTSSSDWAVDYSLGTQKHPGDPNANPSSSDPQNIGSAIDLNGYYAYVGFCGACDVIGTGSGTFKSGIATNAGGKVKPIPYKSAGWHIAKADGLPNRYVTSVKMDPTDPKTVYVAVGGYRRLWTPPGEIDRNRNIGKGHLFVSHDAGAHFTDISANLPNYPVNWVTLRGKRQLIVGTDVGVFVSKQNGVRCRRTASSRCHAFQVLGKGLPVGQVSTVRVSPCDPNELITAVFGRGVYLYHFGPSQKCPPLPKPPPPPPFRNQTVAGPFDFEGSTDGWTDHSSVSPGWQDQPPGNSSGEAMAVSPYQQSGSGTPNSYVLTAPNIKLTARSDVKVSWAERRDTEDCCDYLALQWSSDNRVWNTVYSVAGKNPDFPNYTPVSATFVAPGGTLYLRFVLTSDELIATPPYTGVAVDDVEIKR